jgi:hypothetical protein
MRKIYIMSKSKKHILNVLHFVASDVPRCSENIAFQNQRRIVVGTIGNETLHHLLLQMMNACASMTSFTTQAHLVLVRTCTVASCDTNSFSQKYGIFADLISHASFSSNHDSFV